MENAAQITGEGGVMKLQALEQQINENAPTHAPEFVIYLPPSGAPVECPPGYDITQAAAAASRIAAANPGRTVALYRLTGTAIAPMARPDFVPFGGDDDGA